MTTTVTKSIGSATGRDFATFAAWKAYVEGRGDLTAAGVDEVHIGQMYADSVFTESTLVMPTNTKDATHTVTLQCGSGQSFRDAKGALRYNESNGVAIRLTQTTSGLIQVNAFSSVSGIQFQSTGPLTSGSMVAASAGTLDSCIVDSGASTGVGLFFLSNQPTTGRIRNNLCVSRATGMQWLSSSTSFAAVFEGNTFVKTASGNTAVGIANATAGRVIVRDCVFLGQNGVGVTGANAGPTFTNLSSDGPISQGSNNQASITPSASFVNATSDAALDVRLISGAFLSGKGVASGTLTVDIFGTTRQSPPSIGAHEYVAAGTIYTQTISASTAASAFAVRGPAAMRSAANATAASMTRVASSMRVASLTTAAALSKLARESKAAASATSAAIVKAQAAARVTMAPTTAAPSVSRQTAASRYAISALAGVASRGVMAPRRATTASSAAISRSGARSLIGAVIIVAAAPKIVSVSRLAGPQPAVNVALQSNGGVASAVNTYPGFYEAYANDGVEANAGFWNNANEGQYPVWWQVTLAQSTLVSQVNVWTLGAGYPSSPVINSTPVGPDGLVSFDVQVYNGTTWTTVGSITNNQYAGNSFAFSPTLATVVRVTVYQGGNYQGNYARLLECEVYTVPGGMQVTVATAVARLRAIAAALAPVATTTRTLAAVRKATSPVLSSLATFFTSGTQAYSRVLSATTAMVAAATRALVYTRIAAFTVYATSLRQAALSRAISTAATTSAALVRFASHSLTGTSTGAATISTRNVALRTLAAASAMLGSLQRRVATTRAATTSVLGAAKEQASARRSFMASITTSAASMRMVTALRAASSPMQASLLSLKVSLRAVAASASLVPALTRASTVVRSAAISATAAVSTRIAGLRTVAGTTAPSAILSRSISATRSAVMAATASLSAFNGRTRTLATTMPVLATLARSIFVTRTATTSSAAAATGRLSTAQSVSATSVTEAYLVRVPIVVRRAASSIRATISTRIVSLRILVASAAVVSTVVRTLRATRMAIATMISSLARVVYAVRATASAMVSTAAGIRASLRTIAASFASIATLQATSGLVSRTIAGGVSAVASARRSVLAARTGQSQTFGTMSRVLPPFVVVAVMSSPASVVRAVRRALIAVQPAAAAVIALRLNTMSLVAAQAFTAAVSRRVVAFRAATISTGASTTIAVSITARATTIWRGFLAFLGFGSGPPIVCAHWTMRTRRAAWTASMRSATWGAAQRTATWTFKGCGNE